ncbi:MAG TPA: type II and III secretion system protein [Myxococcota bacterium]|nr:type II and III secretion system protein [Myxococcota bacterium]
MSNPGLAVVVFLALVAGGTTARAGDETALQVQLQVRFIEATDHFARDVGVDFRGFKDDAFVRGAAPSGKPWVATRPDFAAFALADDARIVREPKLVTGDGEPASIAVEAGRGTDLRLTPQISDDGTISLEVEVGLPSPADATPTPGLHRARTTVSLPDGGTFAIGGLTNDSDTSGGVPMLHRIPLLGRLFRHDESESQVRQLVIFVTPTLLDADGGSHAPHWSSPPGRPDGVSRERIYRPRPDSNPNY